MTLVSDERADKPSPKRAVQWFFHTMCIKAEIGLDLGNIEIQL
jgi:hypothetical protein